MEAEARSRFLATGSGCSVLRAGRLNPAGADRVCAAGRLSTADPVTTAWVTPVALSNVSSEETIEQEANAGPAAVGIFHGERLIAAQITVRAPAELGEVNGREAENVSPGSKLNVLTVPTTVPAAPALENAIVPAQYGPAPPVKSGIITLTCAVSLTAKPTGGNCSKVP